MEQARILIVEDDRVIRDGIEIYLKTQGYLVAKAADGLEGLSMISREEPDLAIVDVMMPKMDGISMVEELRKEHDFPVIMLSAKSEVIMVHIRNIREKIEINPRKPEYLKVVWGVGYKMEDR